MDLEDDGGLLRNHRQPAGWRGGGRISSGAYFMLSDPIVGFVGVRQRADEDLLCTRASGP